LALATTGDPLPGSSAAWLLRFEIAKRTPVARLPTNGAIEWIARGDLVWTFEFLLRLFISLFPSAQSLA
jgi:hypothetical protein